MPFQSKKITNFIIVFNILLIIAIILCYYLPSYPENLKSPTILLLLSIMILFPIGIYFMVLEKNKLQNT